MREALVILFVIAVLLALTAFRYRRQIAAMLHVWRMFKTMRQASRPVEKRIENSEKSDSSRLVNCSKCGTWAPETTAIKLGGTYFCSAACLESKVGAR